ncbi:hypothetical protein JRQ81_010112 [Phrynocephalus forsythii]|uniref:Nucleoside diphosphate kinase n=1 Tax=Phrynocephalus forsythii TaxID=171643 RepID=A0A9Q0X7W8_9SAUR|nr:hypothetical protein JRQ81_010112 [Phrynocephalus forsythii]
MTSGPVVAMVWEGHNVVKTSRAMVGETNPAEAKPGTVRGDFSVHVSRNVVHASDSVETAQREINLWFRSDELVNWDCCDHKIITAGKAMAQQGSACQPPPDVETDDCLHEYCYLFSPDILKGKVAFITGGGSGIGFRIAEILMRHSCQTVIASRNLQRVTEAAKKLSEATGQRCLPLTLDVRQPQTIMAAVDEALKEFKRIDIVVNNAAGNFLCPASALSFNGYKTVIEIDTLGTFNVSKVLYEKCLRVSFSLPKMPGRQALQVHAGTAKAAVDAMTKHLAVEWGPHRIRVNSVAPGPITGTEGVRRLAPKGAKENIFQKIPLQRAGNKTEIAHSVLYLASPLSSYVTGTTLVVDGGAWMTTENNFPALLGIGSHSAKL